MKYLICFCAGLAVGVLSLPLLHPTTASVVVGDSSSSPASATVDAGCFNDPWVSNAPVLLTSGPVPWSPPNLEITGDQPEHGGPAAEAVGLLSSPPPARAGAGDSVGDAAWKDTRIEEQGSYPVSPRIGPVSNIATAPAIEGCREIGIPIAVDSREWKGAAPGLTGDKTGRRHTPTCSVAGTSSPAVTDRLLRAIEWTESRGRADAVGDGGRAVGILQIWPVMVADCNRIAPHERFTLADRLDPERSRAMFRVFVAHYCKGYTDEQIARCWNGGPTGDRKQSTEPYWAKVQEAMRCQK